MALVVITYFMLSSAQGYEYKEKKLGCGERQIQGKSLDSLLPSNLNRMKMFFFLLLGVPCCGISQDEIATEGTFIISAICPNGIVMGVDSRQTFVDGNRKVVAYYENSPKIYKHKNVIVGAVGGYIIDGFNIYCIFDKFQAKYPFPPSIGRYYQELLAFAKTILNEKQLGRFVSNQIFISGYEGLTPHAYEYRNGKQVQHINSIDYINSLGKIATDEVFRTNLTFSPTDVIEKNIREIIYDIADQDNVRGGAKRIGGTPSIAIISYGQVIKFDLQTKNSFCCLKDFFSKHKMGKIKLTYVSKQDSVRLHQAFLKNLLVSSPSCP